ncbi:Anion exchange protein [Aphelenchoides bicaudatus]|nr:Anion exchange protein [Aphelenchoides bicaudatus]
MPLNSSSDLRGSSENNVRARVRDRLPSTAEPPFYSGDLLGEALFAPQSIQLSNHVETPIDNVRRVVERDDLEYPPLFCEMMYLNSNVNDEQNTDTQVDEEYGLSWRQVGRWIKFKQTVEGDGTRFSKPHITLLSVHGIMQAKVLLRKGSVLLDAEVDSFIRLCDIVIKNWVQNGYLEEGNVNMVREILYAPKLHLIDGHVRSVCKRLFDDNWRQEIHRSTNVNRRRRTRAVERIEMVANVGALQRPLSAFVRLKKSASLYPEIPDQPFPVKFIFILLNTYENYEEETLGIGYSMGALFSDPIFHKVAHSSFEKYTLGDAVEEYFSQATLIPPGKCRPDTRWEPRGDQQSEHAQIRDIGKLYSTTEEADDEFLLGLGRSNGKHNSLIIRRTGRIFGGLVEDVKRKIKFYGTDFTDFYGGRISQSLAAIVGIFFANLINILTFGAVFERATHQQMGAIENVVSGAISGITFALFAGQPMTILSATGPVFLFEKVVYDFCTSNDWDFLAFRFWMGCWIVLLFLILIATDASALIGLITRFTEEGFATLVSVAFIVQACQKIYEISYEGVRALGGIPQGLACFFKPDIFIFSILLALCTFFVAMKLNNFKDSPYLAWKIRHAISDFGIVIAIVLFTVVSMLTGLDVPKLKFPMTLQPTRIGRDWIVDMFSVTDGAKLVALLPAAFFTILLVMDQQITSGIISRKDNKLKKGVGYHLDLLVLMALIAVFSFLGLPFYAANAVLSVNHIDSLKYFSEIAAPVKRQCFWESSKLQFHLNAYSFEFREQRLTSLLAHFFIGVSLFFAPIVKLVPMPVLTGIFLYVGTMSLLGQQFVQRLGLLFMPIKNQPDFSWLRTVRMHRVHLFTFIQALSVLCLLVIRYASAVAMCFPLMLVIMVLTRIFVLERIFTKNELLSLDDELPNIKKLLKPAKPMKLDLQKMHRLRKAKMKKKKAAEESDELMADKSKRVTTNANGNQN